LQQKNLIIPKRKKYGILIMGAIAVVLALEDNLACLDLSRVVCRVKRELGHKSKRLEMLRMALQAAESREQGLAAAHLQELDGLSTLENEKLSLEGQCVVPAMLFQDVAGHAECLQ
jgi:hypothetical protein